MIRGALALMLIGVALAACGRPTPGAPELPELVELKRDACRRWQDATGLGVAGLVDHCTLAWGACGHGSWACTITSATTCQIVLDRAVPSSRRPAIMTHEVGHALGLRHVAMGCGIMAPANARCISNVDLFELCSKRYCPLWRPECEVSCE